MSWQRAAQTGHSARFALDTTFPRKRPGTPALVLAATATSQCEAKREHGPAET